MKIAVFNSTLSCIYLCIRFVTTMINKKLVFGLFVVCFLGGCASPTAMLGPAYTLNSTGSVLQAGFNYGTTKMITAYTGKSPIENLKEISLDAHDNSKNIQKKTLESEDFYNLVKSRIEKTNGILNLSNQ